MTATVLDGRRLAAVVRADVTARAARLVEALSRPPCLAAVLVGEDPANVAYAQAKGRAAQKCGLTFRLETLPADAGTARAVELVQRLGEDPLVDAILVELPLPPGYDRLAIEDRIDPGRDADGVTSANQGHLLAGTPGPRPATALATLALIQQAGVVLAGAEVVVIGRSVVVGKPVAMLLLAEHATVTIAHSRTRDLVSVTRRADVVVAAAGVPGLVTAAHVRPGAVVIDVGTTEVGSGETARLVGDVAYDEVAEVAGAVTPVPGGVGPLTTALLLQNVVALAEAAVGAVRQA
jgi:methylenetetrahydrofolate dehydrogenase (NADP+)/methenyltetrahydrofolate cyclohydrolase